MTADSVRNKLELLFSSNRLPLRCDVVEDFMGYTALVHGHVPEQFQEAIWTYFQLFGLQFKQVVFCWYPNGGTSIELRLRTE